MHGKATGFAGSKLASLTLVAVLATGLVGCKTDNEKSDAPTSGGETVTTPTTPTAPTTPTTPPITENRAPTITGTPVTTAKISVPYSFQPSASDPDGDKLTFEVRSKPNWATFSSTTGRLEGTPPVGSAGTFTGVQIIVSDGKTTTSLNPFSIEVREPAIGNAELAWQPPTANEDGSQLSDLSGYVIRYGKSAGALDQSVKITNAGTTIYVVENLIEGTWYFSLSSVNSAGVESRPTGYVSKTIS
jgi:hypothetical protein